ncbi:hypothetical protein BDQ17DRAFT_1425778 [Cyathus striatus]|nr:hypothetical protein BDQ17DRAFT_1425778 [Cyathus striatus]
MSHNADMPTTSRSSETANDRILEISQSPGLQFVSTFFRANSSDVRSTVDGLGSIQIGHQTIENAISGFAESSRIGIKVLDELAKLHPFIAAPVLAFKLVVNLDMKRRENNMKVVAVMVQIQDMFCVLLQLRDIKDTTRRDPDGKIQVTGELTKLMERIAEDVEKCASACDVYLKKSFLRKFLKSPVYESRLADYASKFATHHMNLRLALGSFTAIRVEQINDKLDEQRHLFTDIQSQFKELFKRLDTPQEREIRKIIDNKGGASACLDDVTVLWELVTKSKDDSFHKKDAEHSFRGVSRSEGNEITIQDIQNILRQELLEDLDEVLDKNFKLFKGKLDIQNKEIRDSIERQGDRIISYFSGGHEKIINPHIRAIWQEMGWRGSVRAVNFVFALRDYFLSPVDGQNANGQDSQSTSLQPTVPFPSPPPTSKVEPPAIDFMTTLGDEWTKKYINISHLQPILESIDDDGSGFISIWEVNRFTLDCPRGWRFVNHVLREKVDFSNFVSRRAVPITFKGWHLSIYQYKYKIYRLLRKMFLLLEKARRDNRMFLHYYLNDNPILKLEGLLQSTKDIDNNRYDPELTKLVNSMMQQEDSRLKQNLESIRYKLDSVSTVQLVCGPGRVDKYIYPVLYALLQQHVKIFQLARHHILHHEELDWCIESLVNVMQAFDARCKDLKATFKQMQIDPENQLENFAFGMFRASEMKLECQSSTYLSVMQKIYLDPNEDDDINNCPQDLDISVLTYGVQEPHLLPPQIEQLEFGEQSCIIANSPFGDWTGFCLVTENGFQISQDGLFRLSIKESAPGSNAIIGHAQNYIGTWVVNGTYTPVDSGDPVIEVEMTYPDDGYWILCRGIFNSRRMTIIGSWCDGYRMNSKPGDASERQFIFTRAPAEVARFRYSELSFQTSPAHARWKFALDAVMYNVQRKRITKDFVFARLQQALRFKNLLLKRLILLNHYSVQGRSELNEEDRMELYGLEMNVPPSIDWFFRSIASYAFSRLPKHIHIICDKCDKTLMQSRLLCITCRDETFDGVDLCLGCINAKDPVQFEDCLHDASHSLVRCDYPIHDFQVVSVIQKARELSERIKLVFRTTEKALKEKNEIDNTKENNKTTTSNTEITESDPTSGKKCCYCEKPISLPCWVFLNDESKLVCDTCDEQKLLPPLPHKVNLNAPPTEQHFMLRIVNPEKAKVVEKDRLIRVEEQMEKVLERTMTLEGKLEEHLFNIAKPEVGGVGAIEGGHYQKSTSSEQRIEERLSAMESRISSLEGTLLDILGVLRDQKDALNR